jgi:hypothetical protein
MAQLLLLPDSTSCILLKQTGDVRGRYKEEALCEPGPAIRRGNGQVGGSRHFSKTRYGDDRQPTVGLSPLPNRYALRP